jgi:FtsP/CotA-like multicopper oxidase with cupredoxin domain
MTDRVEWDSAAWSMLSDGHLPESESKRQYEQMNVPSIQTARNLLSGRGTSRRAFLRNAPLATAALMARGKRSSFAWAQTMAGASRGEIVPGARPDHKLEIAEIEWELSPKKKIRTAAYNGQIPGPLLRLTEGRPAIIEIVNRLDRKEIVHWHGQWIPVVADGSMEEGSPPLAAGSSSLVQFTPKPAGLHWYHTHAMAHRDLKRGLYSGQFGVLYVEGASGDPGNYDLEQFIVLHDWEPYYAASDDGSMMVNYACGSINGKMLGHDEPIRVREGQRVLFQVLNASATEMHWLALPGHKFQVLAMDGAPVATQAEVSVLRLGPAERITALVKMNTPGVWVLGEARKEFRDAGMGTVIEYAGQTGKPREPEAATLAWDYRMFGDAAPAAAKPDVTIPMVFTSKFKGHGALDEWMINGKSYPESEGIVLREGLRHRLVFDNRSTDDHPVHLHRHNFELVSTKGAATGGVHKDIVVVEAGTKVEADLIASNPGNTLFHCHQQDHMDMGFMALLRYAD